MEKHLVVSVFFRNFANEINKVYNMKKEMINLTLLKIACNQFDYFSIVEIIENATIKNETDRNCGLWQEEFTILPNIDRVKMIVMPSQPITMGKYWLVFHNSDITDTMQITLEKEDYWLIDYITEKDFAKWGIEN